MPTGKYSFYLHPDDRTDVAATATLDLVSQTLRGEFYRTSAIAGSILFRIDCRLPGLLAELFDGQLRGGQFFSLLGAVSGSYQATTEIASDVLHPVHYGKEYVQADRRRFTLQLLDDGASREVVELIESLPTRIRGQQLRNLLIAGFALHTMDQRFPRLLASLPVPPRTVDELRELAVQITGMKGITGQRPATLNQQMEPEPAPVIRETTAPDSHLVSNMKKLF